MARKRKSKGPEEAIAGLAVLGFFYAYVTGRLPQLFHALVLAAAVAAVAIVGVVIFRRSKRGADRSDLSARDVWKSQADAPESDMDDEIRRAHDRRVRNPASPTVAAQSKPTAWTLASIRALEWKRFEELCESYWKAKGYRAELTGRGADGGIDINLYRPSAPDKILAVIQCKSRSTDSIGVATARELFGVMHHISASMGILVTTTDFHPAARDFVVGKNIKLVNGPELLKQLLELPEASSQEILARVFRDDYITPTCPSCDVKMIERSRKAGGTAFYGCRNYPRCSHTFDLRSPSK